ncbi:glycosyltransferase [Spirochaetia bacterium 38H-sp]|uniref:Glycosyltransferase n=1 Tax=Rarispira pelagica TaxID=3141764 RepID=A0ABU9U9X9_9SPIR
MNLAPIVLFVYNRPWHTKQTVEALQKNELASDSELFIFSDSWKNDNDKSKVLEVREYLKTIYGFKKVTIIERDKNWGLANNIIDGVTKIVNEYGKIIVLEDDIVASPYFLRFMNAALDSYEKEKKIWHISGWTYPIDPDGLGDVFLWRVMNCWGWATWADRWNFFEKKPHELIAKFSKRDIYRFNLDGTEDFWAQVKDNLCEKIDTWAIFWYATIFINNGLCLNPTVSLVSNVGLDGSGVNCCSTDEFNMESFPREKPVYIDLNMERIEENTEALRRIKRFIRKRNSFLSRISKKINKYLKPI